MNNALNNLVAIVKGIISENNDLYFPIFDDPFYILNTEDKEKRMIGRALSILLSFERNSSKKILIVGNRDISEIEEGLSNIREYLKDKGFDPDLLSDNIEMADVSDTTAFIEKTKDNDYSLVILENAEEYDDVDPDTSEKLKAIRGLRIDRALITAVEDFDPGYEDQEEEESEPGTVQYVRGKYKSCGGDVFYNPAYSDYKGVLNAVMDALGLKPDDAFRKTLRDDDMTIFMTGNHMFLFQESRTFFTTADELRLTHP